MNERVLDVTLQAVRGLGEELDNDALRQASAGTALYGSGGALDSVGLVTLVSEVEQRLADAFGKDIVLADERAMSRSRSPFQSVGALADYAAERLAEEGAGA